MARRSPRRSRTRRDAEAAGYRSGFEQRVAEELDKAGVVALYEAVTIPYTKVHTYKPDFSTRRVYLEAKGRFTASDRQKHLDIKKQHPELEVRFVFQLDNKLSPRSETRYSDWCERHGFKYCIGPSIPDEWVAELRAGKPKVRARSKRGEAAVGVSGADYAPAGRRGP